MDSRCRLRFSLQELILLALITIFFSAPPGFVLAQGERESLDFFESKIRPALIEYCLECHSTDTEASGGLLLDSKRGWQQGGDLGTSIVPGEPESSRLMRAIAYDDPDLQMPPDGKLSDELISAFEQWIRLGAADPRTMDANARTPAQTGLPVERAQDHWSYRPIGDSQPPLDDPKKSGAVAASSNAIDIFINARLNQAEVSSNAIAHRAPKEVLVRRLYFDLSGLPPTPEELEQFLADESEDSYEVLVDRLLASPRFGETFARQWMDVVRYADSITLRGFVLPQAWRYRDYLVQAFAADRSFATMIEEQIAGDQLESDDLAERVQQLVATGFWALGNTNLEQQDKTQLEMDYIDEQLEVMGRAFLGQTIGCARCHDHKFDPIPNKDYYALAGILRSSVAFQHDNVSKWIEEPLPLNDEDATKYQRLDDELSSLNSRLAEVNKKLNKVASSDKRMIPVDELEGIVVDSAHARLVGNWVTSTFIGPIIGSSYIHDDNASKGEKTATLAPEDLPAGTYRVRFAYTASANRPSALEVKVFSAEGEKSVIVDQRKPPEEDGLWVSLGEYRFEENGQAYVLVSNANTVGNVIVDAVQFLPIEQLPPGKQASRSDSEIKRSAAVTKALQAESKELAERKKVIDAQLAQRPRYLTIRETNQPRDIPIHIRGDVHNLGDVVPRGFLTAINGASVKMPQDSGGRLELARWITSADNPLSARVYSNRVWGWLMGRGLVASENNFGTTGAEPSHPELLDWLARQLIQSDWSTKTLVRMIVLSDAYQRDVVEGSSTMLQLDPDNRLYWRGHARRISVESLRDAMLRVSGELDLAIGDSLIAPTLKEDYNYQHRTFRRSIYHPVFRNSLPELFEAFDFANTSFSVGRRPRSTVAPQALALMNHPWVTARATVAARKFYDQIGPNSAELVRACYLECFSRMPTTGEQQACEEFLDQVDVSRQEQLAQLLQTLFASIDFRFLD
jgi:hypothetical protein